MAFRQFILPMELLEEIKSEIFDGLLVKCEIHQYFLHQKISLFGNFKLMYCTVHG